MKPKIMMALMLIGAGPVLAFDYAWVEGENPAKASFKTKAGGAVAAGMLSGDKMLYVDEAGGPSKLTDGKTLDLEYVLDVPKDGKYDLWLRIGFEWIRPKVAYRLNGQGEWKTIGHNPAHTALAAGKPSMKADDYRLSTNVKGLGAAWAEIAWWNLGTTDLKAGKNTVELKFSAYNQEDPMLALDVVALVSPGWVPEGRLKPGQEYDGEDDRKAAAKVYELAQPADGARSAVKLIGPWQIARWDDPDMDQDQWLPVTALPDLNRLHFMGIHVPSSLWDNKETAFGHRVVYRTKVNVPKECTGRAFTLHFSGTNWLASVFINGELAGTHRGVWIPWDLDVTKFIKPGQANEVVVVIKGSYYALDTKHYGRGDVENAIRNRPPDKLSWVYWVAPIYPSSKGDGSGVDYGIVNPVTLTCAGPAYTEEVGIRPSVEKKRLDAEVTVRNTAAAERKVQIRCEAINDQNGKVEKAFAPVDLTVPANASATTDAGGEWADPKLWWPVDHPDLYRLRITVNEGGKPVDVKEELFGFREVTVKGTGIFINGLRRNFWNWVDVAGKFRTDGKSWVEQFRREGDRFIRFSTDLRLCQTLPCREDQLEFFDRQGVSGRLCSMIDGMFISYVLVVTEPDPQDPKKQVTRLNEPVWEGFREHIAQLTKAYRNHPSVVMYQIENELVYINGQNRHSGSIEMICEAMNEVANAGKKNDPTRPYTVGGGGDLFDRLEVNSPHYPEGLIDWYPDNAYTIVKIADHSARWPWKKDKPWLPGESVFAADLEKATAVIGDAAFRTEDDARRGKARYVRMMYTGYRWGDVAGFCPWTNLYGFEDSRLIFSDIAVLTRKQSQRLYAGQDGQALVKVMNDSLSREPVKFEWSYEAGGKKIAGDNATLNIEPGMGKELTLAIRAPETNQRLEGVLKFKAEQKGSAPYVEERSLPVLPMVKSLAVKGPVTLLDRSGKLEKYLTDRGVKVEKIDDLAVLKDRTGLLIIGPQTLTPKESLGTDLLVFAARGNRVIVLEQDNPVAGGNLPAAMPTTARYGGYAHPQALGMPIFQDLGAEDLIDWAGGHPTYLPAYLKPAQGGRSLAQCGELLPHTCLVEMPIKNGVMVFCQLRVGAKLGVEPAADALLRNLLKVYAEYQPASGVAAVVSPEDPVLAKKIADTGVNARGVASVEEALDRTKYVAAVIHASPKNLAELNRLKGQAAAYQDAGGWIVLNGLDPKGIDEFNKFMGTSHMIRPFRLERVTMERGDFPLVATLGNRDMALISTKHLQHSKYWKSWETFSWVIDGANVAGFTQPPGAPADPYAPYAPTFNDNDPYNYVNGLTTSDHWRYARQIFIPDPGKPAATQPADQPPPAKSEGQLLAEKLGLPERHPTPLVFKFRRPETISQINIWNNANYWTNKDVDLVIDGDPAQVVKVVLPDDFTMVPVKLDPPREVKETIAFVVRSWRGPESGKAPEPRLTGLDNIEFIRAMPPKGVFIDCAGGLVAWPRGQGGVLLNQIRFIDQDADKVNNAKKLGLMGVMLQNMGVGVGSSVVAVPGLNVKYTPVKMLEQCNAFLATHEDKPSLFGTKGVDLAEMPVGDQRFAGVDYHIQDYATAPVPDVLVVGSKRSPRKEAPLEVKGIPVNAKADMIFFLQAGCVTYGVAASDLQKMGEDPGFMYELGRYVINYADGQRVIVPVGIEKHVCHWIQASPDPLPMENAVAVRLAKPPSGVSVDVRGQKKPVPAQSLVAYSMPFTNPRPEVEIKSIDVIQGLDNGGKPTDRGALAVLAITLGTIQGK